MKQVIDKMLLEKSVGTNKEVSWKSKGTHPRKKAVLRDYEGIMVVSKQLNKAFFLGGYVALVEEAP